MPHHLLEGLTPNQRKAVEQTEGPLLVLAGPGSGKTRVITRRIAWLIESGVAAEDILAITFTNKAAREMVERVAALAPGSRVWISTFHSFCARLLRRYAPALGLSRNFTIYDTSDQKSLLKRVLSDVDVDAVHFPPGRVLARISDAKNDLIDAEMFVRGHAERIGDHFQSVVSKAYPAYQHALTEANSVDFDDLLFHTVRLLRENAELREELDQRFRYVLVDEYQDTNAAQYEIIRGLSLNEPNLCVTGDPDQSIYGWRGAKIENILRFEKDFPNTNIVRLEENFRSTGEILSVAAELIRHNSRRKAKELIAADAASGPPPELLTFPNEKKEAESIATRIRDTVAAGDRQFSDFAIFYRVNSLSRVLELALARSRVPFQIAAGTAFFDRREIKDLLAYLKLIHNPKDEVAFQRIVNVPPRGIGKKTQSLLGGFAREHGLDLLAAARDHASIPALSKRARTALSRFCELIDDCAACDGETVGRLLDVVIERTDYIAGWEGSLREEDQQRLANVQELAAAARQYDDANPEDGSLEGFLETTSLVNETDRLDESAGHVTLMSLHAAKGLEYPVVFIVGVEQNLIPHERSLKVDDPVRAAHELEEERRLLFVGITRAMEELFLTQTRQRNSRGRDLFTIPSDFLREMTLAQPVVYEPDWEVDHDFETEFAPVETERLEWTAPDELASKVQTAADLQPQAEVGGMSFAPGMLVRHPRYGRGRVVKVSGFSKRRTIRVEFEEDDRIETFVAGKAPLQPIGVS